MCLSWAVQIAALHLSSAGRPNPCILKLAFLGRNPIHRALTESQGGLLLLCFFIFKLVKVSISFYSEKEWTESKIKPLGFIPVHPGPVMQSLRDSANSLFQTAVGHF